MMATTGVSVAQATQTITALPISPVSSMEDCVILSAPPLRNFSSSSASTFTSSSSASTFTSSSSSSSICSSPEVSAPASPASFYAATGVDAEMIVDADERLQQLPRLFVFDKDGTLICFHSMWQPWLQGFIER